MRSAGFLGLCLSEQKVGNPLKARDYCRRALGYAPNDPIAHFLLGNVNRDLFNARQSCNYLRDARSSYVKMLEINPHLDESKNARNYVGQIDGLRIVVVEGEDAVNIIQQNTAVRPVVEVRDRTNLPVPGVLVTFSIEGGRAASFGGASTLTVATNAAGQAAVTGLTPTAAGAFQIQVQAAFQGQVATATIAQTNVMTAAAATTGATGASGGGAGGATGAGGGVSATTVGIVGAAIGGGTLVATQAAKDNTPSGPTTFTSSFTGPFVSTLTAARSCTITRAITATMTLELDLSHDTNVNGDGEITGTDSVTSQDCSGPAPVDAIGRRFRVSGTRASFGFRDERSDSRPLETDPQMTVSTTTNVQFEASLNGDVVTATLRVEERSVTAGPNPSSTGAGSGSYPITLRKQ